MTARPQPKDGERRGLPDGGSQVFGGGRWHDARSAAGRRYASPPANDDARGPINIAAEQALLGALLLKPDAFFEVSGLVRPEHLHEPFHQRLFEVIKDRAEKNRGAAPELLATLFADDPAFADLGGVRYLADLIDRAPPPANAPDYARELATLYARRRLMEIGAEITALGAHSAAGDPDELIGDAERLLADASVEAGGRGGFVSARAMVKDAITYARTRPGKVEFTFGVDALDAHLGGMNPGETTLLAARPGVGKTVGALTVARGNAQAGLGTCVFSLEMSRNALGLRLASDLAFDRHAPCYLGESQNPTADKALKNLLSPEQWAKLEEAERIVAGWPLLIDDRSGLTLAQIEAEARRAHRGWARKGIKPGPLILDHVAKIRPPMDRKGNRHLEVADLSAGCAEMAKRLGVPVLALVQLNRGVEGREDKRPLLSDLRQAGELEEDARQVIFLYRPEYYLREPTGAESFEERCEREEKLQRVSNRLYWLIEKNSHGPRGQVETFCDIACSAIRDWEART